MTGPEAFALLGFDPRPLLDPAAIEAAFRQRARSLHPDAGGSPAAFARLTAARQRLAAHSARLQALLECLPPLPDPAAPSPQPPRPDPVLASLHFDAAPLLRDLESLLAAPPPCAPSAIQNAVRDAALKKAATRAAALLPRLHAALRTLHTRLAALDARWTATPPPERPALRHDIASLRASLLSAEKLHASLSAALARAAALPQPQPPA